MEYDVFTFEVTQEDIEKSFAWPHCVVNTALNRHDAVVLLHHIIFGDGTTIETTPELVDYIMAWDHNKHVKPRTFVIPFK